MTTTWEDLPPEMHREIFKWRRKLLKEDIQNGDMRTRVVCMKKKKKRYYVMKLRLEDDTGHRKIERETCVVCKDLVKPDMSDSTWAFRPSPGALCIITTHNSCMDQVRKMESSGRRRPRVSFII